MTGWRGRLNVSGTNDDETFGGFLRLQQNAGGAFGAALAWVWWRPIEAVKFQVGILDDFYVNDIVDTFGGNAEETGVHNTGTSFYGWSSNGLYSAGKLPTGGNWNWFDHDDDEETPQIWAYNDGSKILTPEGGVGSADDMAMLSFDDLMLGAFAQEFSTAGAALTIAPIEGLSINLAVPYGLGDGNNNLEWDWEAEKVYKEFLAQVQYDLTDIARVSLAFKGHMGQKREALGEKTKWKPGLYEPTITSYEGTVHDGDDYGTIYLGVYFTMIENLSLNLGLAFTMPEKQTWEYDNGADGTGNGTVSYEITNSRPLQIGLGATFDLDPLSVAARLGVGLGGKVEEKQTLGGIYKTEYDGSAKPPLSKTLEGNTQFGAQLLPSYDLGFLKIFLNCGLTITSFADNYNKDLKIANPRDAQVGFWVNPYVEKTMGPGSFFAGLDLYTNGPEIDWTKTIDASKSNTNGKYTYKYADTVLNWRIPVGMKFVF